MKKVPEIVKEPMFLKFIEHYADKFRHGDCMGKWLYEYQDMENKGWFKPEILRKFYIQICLGTFQYGFIRDEAIWYICSRAADATKAYIDEHAHSLYRIVLVTGEVAVDDDGDEYADLTYGEACSICKALNEEAEEYLFFKQKM